MATVQASNNYFLAGLSLEDFSLLRNHLVPRALNVGDVLHRCGDRIDEIVFPHSGLIVMRMPLHSGLGAAVGLIGSEGFAGGYAASAAAPATCDCEVLAVGKASKIPASAFRNALDCSRTLRHWASQFDNALIAQAQQTAACNAAHSVEARLCRWLLELRERSDERRISLTQSTMAELLGVRRTTINLAAGRLEAAGVMNCRRGYMELVDHQRWSNAVVNVMLAWR